MRGDLSAFYFRIMFVPKTFTIDQFVLKPTWKNILYFTKISWDPIFLIVDIFPTEVTKSERPQFSQFPQPQMLLSFDIMWMFLQIGVVKPPKSSISIGFFIIN